MKLALLLIASLTVMSGAVIAPAMPEIEQVFSGHWAVKWIITLHAIVIAIAAPLIGHYLGMRAKKPAILCALICYGISGCFVYFYPDSLALILLSRVCLGLAVAALMTATSILIVEWFQGAERGKFMGLQAAFTGYGGVVFLLAGGWLADVTWRAPFLLYGLAFLVLVVASVGLRDKTVSAQSGSVLNQQDNLHPALASLLMVLAFFEISLLYGLVIYYPFLMSDVSASKVGMAIAVMMLVSSTVALMYPLLAKRWSFTTIHLFGLFILAIGFGSFLWLSGFVLSLISMLIIGIGFGLNRPNLMVWLMALTPIHQRGRMIGLVTTCFFVGQFCSPILLQPWVDAWSEKGMFFMLACCSLLMIICLSSVHVLRRKQSLS